MGPWSAVGTVHWCPGPGVGGRRGVEVRVTGEEEVWGGQTSGNSLPSLGLGAGFWGSVCPPDDSQMHPCPHLQPAVPPLCFPST